MKYLVSLAIWVGNIILTVMLYLATLFFTVILYPFDKDRKVAHAQCFWWADALIRLNPFWKLKVVGLENIDRRQTYVVVANHQSMADIVVLYKTRMQFKWVAKDSILKVPCIGGCLALAKHICLERGEYGSIRKVYREAVQWLRKGMSVLFFPEGTRSNTDQMNDFLNGAFKLAIKEKRPILPISIQGTREAIPKGDWVFKTRVSATMTVLPAIETAGLKPGEFAALRDEVRAKLEALAV
jgi:1-acyl-sn-glycerol-3-phosphate acyltransferase